MKKLLLAAMAAVMTCVSMLAQAPGTGAYPFAAFDNRGFDSVNVGNLNTRFNIPIVNRAGRGLGFNYAIQYEGLIWNPVNNGSTTVWTPGPNWGFTGQLNGTGFVGYLSSNVSTIRCGGPILGGGQGTLNYQTNQSNYAYHDAFGAIHPFNYSVTGACSNNTGGGSTTSGNGSSSDGSGYTLINGSQVLTKNGITINPGFSSTGQTSANEFDSNGNEISFNGSGSFTDTRGINALTISGSSPITFSYPVALQASSATTAAANLYYKQYTVRTNFGCSGIVEYGSSSVGLVDHITLADGSTYSFTYEATPGATDGAVSARIASITLPTGGQISYAYSGGCGAGAGTGIENDGTQGILRRTTSDGTRTYGRFGPAGYSSTNMTDEKGNLTVYSFTSDTASGNYYETHRKVYQGSSSSGTPLQDRATCYNNASGTCDATPLTLPITEVDVTESFNGGSQSLAKNSYDSYGNLLNSAQYSGSTLLENSAFSYNANSETTSAKTTDVSGNIVSLAAYGYDETTPTATSGLPQHVAVSGTRGNQTSAHISIDGSSTNTLTTTTAYYDSGMPVSTTAPGGFTTSYGYDATQTFATSTTLPTPLSGVALSTSVAYDSSSGVPTSLTGMNSGQTFTAAKYDPLLRLTTLNTPEGGQINATYTPNQLSTITKMSSSLSTDQETFLDAYGRVKRVAVASSSGWYLTDSCYDATGLLQYKSTAYVSSSQNPSSYQCAAGTGDQYSYDALGRTSTANHADGSWETYIYGGRSTKVAQSSGVSRVTQYDLLGRISSVCELSSNPNMPGSGPPVDCGADQGPYSGFLTTYLYALASHSTTVYQGSQARVFQTDAIGRTTHTSEPEAGATTYSYAYNGTGLQVVRTRPKANVASNSAPNPIPTTTTTYQYDKLNRLLSIAYSDGTPTKGFGYDEAGNNNNIPNMGSSKGQMTNAYVNGASLLTWRDFGYDIMGRVCVSAAELPDWVGQPAHDVITRYGYDLASNLTTESYGQSPTSTIASLTYSYNTAGQLTYVTGGQGSGNNGATPYSTVPSTMTPFGPQITEAGNGLYTVISYNGTGRVSSKYVCSNSTHANCTNGGQIYAFIDTVVGGQVTYSGDALLGQHRNYTYDEFGRLTGLSTEANSGSNIAMNFIYDRWGNRWGQNITAGSGPQPQLSFNTANNQVNGYTYDVAGNVINDGNHTYAYDAENQLVSIDNGSTASYTYDALNQRVKIVTAQGTERYGFDLNGRRQTAWNNNSTALDSVQYYAGSKPIAYWSSTDGNIHFEHGDWLGTERVRTTANASVEGSYVSLPFGDGAASSGTDTVPGHFALLDQDGSAGLGLSHAMFREYSSTAGRWMSPDPYAGSYDAENPQTLNRYSYVLNSPTTYIDPNGTDHIDPSGNPCFSSNASGGQSGNTSFTNTINCSYSGPPSPGSTQIPWYISEYGDQPDFIYGNPAAWAALGQKTTPAPDKPVVLQNPCQVQGRALPPSAYAMAGKGSPWYSLNFALDVHYGWGSGQYLDAQPLTTVPDTWAAAAYGNYVYGVYMQAAGFSMEVTMRGAQGYASTKTYPAGTPMQPGYPGLPAANAQNISNGFNAQSNGTICHATSTGH